MCLVGPVRVQTRFEHRTCPKMNKNNKNINSLCKLYLNVLTSSLSVQKDHSDPNALSMDEPIHLRGLVSAGAPVMIQMC